MIRQLSLDLNQTVHLVVEDNEEVLYIDKHDPSGNENRLSSKIGKTAPMYVTAVGKAILATKSNEEIRAIWNKTDIQPFTKHTITSLDAFMMEIEKVRQKGYAIDNEENEYGVLCIGTVFLAIKILQRVQSVFLFLLRMRMMKKKLYILKRLLILPIKFLVY